MEFAIIDEDYDVAFASTLEMRLLFSNICDYQGESYDEKVGEYIHIYDPYDDNYEFFVKIKEDRLREIERQWEEVRKKRPAKIFVKREGENFVFEVVEYEPRKVDEIDLDSVKIESSDIFNKSDKTFNGGFHHLPKSKDKDFELLNKYCDQKDIITSDVKFKEDFTVNHSFFPEGWSVDKVKKKVLESINKLSVQKYVEVKDRVFSFYGNTEGEAITIQTIINDKGEILTAYPIPWREK